MGLTRQTVRTTIKELETTGFVELTANPHHQRAHLVVLTATGERALSAAMERQVLWARGLTADLNGSDMTGAAHVLQIMLTRLLADAVDDASRAPFSVCQPAGRKHED